MYKRGGGGEGGVYIRGMWKVKGLWKAGIFSSNEWWQTFEVS